MHPTFFDPGLEHVAVAETTLSEIDGDAGELVIGGFPVEQLAAKASYEESCFLLVHGRLPTEDELAAFEAALTANREICEPVRDILEAAAAADTSVMEALRMGVAASNIGTEATDDVDVATRLVAVFPTLVATYWRYREGVDPLAPRADLGHAANYRYMLTGTEPTEAERRGLETCLVTLVEHGLNPSTFAARVVVSTRSDLVSAGTAAVGALKGTRHGGRLEPVFEMLTAAGAAESYESYVRERLSGDQPLLGFGHRLYQVRDPRAAVLAAAAERLSDESDDAFLTSVREFESVASRVLETEWPDRQVKPTVEFYAAALLDAVGVPSELFTATFAVARVGGWMGHCLEQLDADTLLRPVSQYVGRTERTWKPLEDRYVAGDSVIRHRPRSASLEPISETLDVLSEPNRLEILLTLYDIDGPADYSRLRAGTSIDDKGRFNYHLRQLREYFVRKDDDGYGLTRAGERFVETVVTNDRLLGGPPDEA